MEIGGSILSLFNPYNLSGDQRAKQQQQQNAPLETESRGRGAGGGVPPSYTPPSISSVMWAMQAAGDTTIKEETQADIDARARHDQLTDALHDYTDMNPAEAIRKRVLDQLGLDEDSLKGMDPDARAAVEKQIAEAIKRELAGVEGGSDKPSVSDLPQTADDTDAQNG